MPPESAITDHSDSTGSEALAPEVQPASPLRGPGESHDGVPGLRRARTTFRSPRRSMTSHKFNPNTARGRRWEPGAEPGLDPYSLQGNAPHLKNECDITFVRFSQDDIDVSFYGNESIGELIDDVKGVDPEHCKWINVNGLSWDVISALGRHFKLHPLAVEDVLSRRNRTKADWYADHAYVVLPLQKLIHVDEEEDNHEGGESRPGFIRSLFSRAAPDPNDNANLEKSPSNPVQKYELSSSFAQLKQNDMNAVRSLQRYHGGQNEDRIGYMEEHRALKNDKLNICVEQVSLFLTTDNTVISFFEHSADDIEKPILGRLNSKEHTVLRRSNDSSLLLQALIDAIVDMALPVCTAYQNAIDELELNVLTSPQLQHTNALYVLSSEVSQFRATLAPINGLIDSLRDHSSPFMQAAVQQPFDPNDPKKSRPLNLRHNTGNASTVVLSPTAKIYLADVADHVTVVLDSLEQIRRASDNMSSLIWNTIQAWQNESMRGLTNITVIFLPLTFITGYFGQNFTEFAGIEGSDILFWQIALPVVFVIAAWVLKDSIYRMYQVQRQKLGIRERRKKRGIKMA